MSNVFTSGGLRDITGKIILFILCIIVGMITIIIDIFLIPPSFVIGLILNKYPISGKSFLLNKWYEIMKKWGYE
jgi:hypothetical protein